MNYFIIKNNRQEGPFTIDELKAQGITSETLVWTEGMTNWTPAWQVEELKDLLFNSQETATPPPFTPSQYATNSERPYQTTTANGYRQAVQPPLPKKNRHIGLWLGVIVAFLALTFAFTNPDKRAHQDAIRDSLTSYVDEKTVNENDDFITAGLKMMSRMLTGSVFDALSNTLDYHNYLFFSKTTVRWNGKDHTVSYGFLGKIITMNSDDITKALERKSPGLLDQNDASNAYESTEESTEGQTETDVNSTDADQTANDENTSNKNATDQIVNTIGNIVKEKVKQESDSTTGSGLQKIIDGVLDLLKK